MFNFKQLYKKFIRAPDEKTISHISFSSDERKIVGSSCSGKAYVWDLDNLDNKKVMDGHTKQAMQA